MVFSSTCEDCCLHYILYLMHLSDSHKQSLNCCNLGCVWFRVLDLGVEAIPNHVVRASHILCLVGWDKRWLAIASFLFGSTDEEWTSNHD